MTLAAKCGIWAQAYAMTSLTWIIIGLGETVRLREIPDMEEGIPSWRRGRQIIVTPTEAKNKAGLNSQPHLTSLTRASPTGPVSKKMLDC